MIPHKTNDTASRTCRMALIAGGLLVPFLTHTPAIAATQVAVMTSTVDYGDLNLATRRGAQELYHRITTAAYKVCWPLDHGDTRGMKELDACLHDAVAGAVARLDNPAVTAIHTHLHSPAPLATTPSRRQ